MLILVFVVLVLAKTIRIVPQARAGIVERFGKYKTTLQPGLNIVTPFVDRVRYVIDLREQVVSFPPQPVITEDNLVVSIDTVIYFQVTDPVSATYEIANYISGDRAAHHDHAAQHRRWHGPRADADLPRGDQPRLCPACSTRPPDAGASASAASRSRASTRRRRSRTRWRSRCAPTATSARSSSPPRASASRPILTAEGNKQAAILNAEGDREALILRAQANREAAILKAQGEGQAIQTVFQAIHDGQPDQALLAYQYLQMMPKIAEGSANKVWVVPSRDHQGARGAGLGGPRGRRHPEVTRVDRAVRVDTDAESARSDEADAQLSRHARGGAEGDRRGRGRGATSGGGRSGRAEQPPRGRPG